MRLETEGAAADAELLSSRTAPSFYSPGLLAQVWDPATDCTGDVVRTSFQCAHSSILPTQLRTPASPTPCIASRSQTQVCPRIRMRLFPRIDLHSHSTDASVMTPPCAPASSRATPPLRCAAVGKSAGGAICALVREWKVERLAGMLSGTAPAAGRLAEPVDASSTPTFTRILFFTLFSRAAANSTPLANSARTLPPRPPSCRRSSSRIKRHLLPRPAPARRDSHSPVASCCSRRTSPCLRPGTSSEATTTSCPSRTSMAQQTRRYSP